jgi:adenylate cyclase
VNALYPGVGVHSAVVNSIRLWSFIHEAPAWLNAAIIVAMGLVVGAAAGRLSTRASAAVSAALLVGWAALAWALFAYAGVWVAMAGPVVAGALAYAAVTAWRHFVEERQKRHIREAFQHYLAPAVVEQVLSQPERLKLGGDRKELTVFFSDIVGFTPISEGLEPEELVALLNDYLSEMSEVILETKGYINKYEGDLIMAVFGAPLDDPEHAVTACRAALESQRRLGEFRERLARENRPILRARIGINSGVMLVGNMGSRRLFDYTVMGDNVNVGSRLEGANKAFGTEIMIGENTFTLVKDLFETRRLGLVAVKGRVKPVGAWELIAEKGKCPPLVAKLLPSYERGLAAYAEQKWDDAMAAFAECLKIHPGDGPSRAYLNRCADLRRSERLERWDGSFTLDPK